MYLNNSIPIQILIKLYKYYIRSISIWYNWYQNIRSLYHSQVSDIFGSQIVSML